MKEENKVIDNTGTDIMNTPYEERSVMFQGKIEDNNNAVNPSLLNMKNSVGNNNASFNMGVTKSSVTFTPTFKTNEGVTFTSTVTLDKNKGVSSVGGTVRIPINRKK